MLVAPLQIHIRRPSQLRPFAMIFKHGTVAGTGVKPDVHDIFFFADRSAAALRTAGKIPQKLLRSGRPPGVAPLFLHFLRNGADAIGRQDNLAALLAVKGGDRNAPNSLAADAPIGTISNHVADAVLTPRGNPSNLVNGGQCLFFKCGDGDKPLIRRAENNGFLAAPAVRVGVRNAHPAQQTPGFGKGLKD